MDKNVIIIIYIPTNDIINSALIYCKPNRIPVCIFHEKTIGEK